MALPSDRRPYRLTVRVTPKGGRDSVDGWTTDEAGRPVLKLRVSAPAREGAANDAVVALIARSLGLPRSAVRVAAGATARVKRLEIDGIDEGGLAAAFGRP